MRTIIGAAAFAVALTGAAAADEVWSNPAGDLVYETDIEPYAVISAPWDGESVMLYVEGMAFNYEMRSLHDGFWIGGPDTATCDVAISGPDGRASYTWGRLLVTFDRSSFPSGFTVLMGQCFEEPDRMLRAEPVVG